MRRPPDVHHGDRFGRLVITSEKSRLDKHRTKVTCRCDCGIEREFIARNLVNGTVHSCGCLGERAPLQRFWEKVKIDPEKGCWVWQACGARGGYSWFWDGDTGWTGHKWAYLNFIGPVPQGLVLDHLCRNRLCVNPAHLEPVTAQENLRRGTPAPALGFCYRGHELTPENSIMDKRGGRKCKLCTRTYQREWERRKREEKKSD